MKISLITVCWNSAAVIRTALESVTRQKTKVTGNGGDCQIEYIVVDGGSTDGTLSILEEYVEKEKGKVKSEKGDGGYPFSFRYISEPDRGMYDAMNKGIRMATGSAIGILNADDALAEDDTLLKIAKVWNRFEWEDGHRIDCVYGNIRFVDGGVELNEMRARKTKRVCFARLWRPWMLQWGYMPPHPGIFIRKECFEKWGYYEPDRKEYRIAADYELLIRFFRRNRMKARYMPICTTVMRTGGVSTKDVEARKKLNEEIVKGNRVNGYFCIFPMLLPKYFVKIWEVILPRLGVIK